MSFGTVSIPPDAVEPTSPDFKRHWRSWLHLTASAQASRCGGCHARFVKLFSAQVDDAVVGITGEAACAVRRLAEEWEYRPRHEIEHEERWGEEQEPHQWIKHPFALCFALGVPILAAILLFRWMLGYEQTTLMSVVSGVAAAHLALHLVSGMRRVSWSWGLLLLAIFLPPVAPFADHLQRLIS